MGVARNHTNFDGISHYTSSSYWGTRVTMETPICLVPSWVPNVWKLLLGSGCRSCQAMTTTSAVLWPCWSLEVVSWRLARGAFGATNRSWAAQRPHKEIQGDPRYSSSWQFAKSPFLLMQWRSATVRSPADLVLVKAHCPAQDVRSTFLAWDWSSFGEQRARISLILWM